MNCFAYKRCMFINHNTDTVTEYGKHQWEHNCHKEQKSIHTCSCAKVKIISRLCVLINAVQSICYRKYSFPRWPQSYKDCQRNDRTGSHIYLIHNTFNHWADCGWKYRKYSLHHIRFRHWCKLYHC